MLVHRVNVNCGGWYAIHQVCCLGGLQWRCGDHRPSD